MPTFKEPTELFVVLRTFLENFTSILWGSVWWAVQSRFTASLLSTCYTSSSLDAQSLKVKDKRDTRRRTIRMLLFTSATNMKPMHRLTPLRKSLPFAFPILSHRPSYIRALFRSRISWKVESYDPYVLEIGKSIHILYALVFFIYTGRTPLHKRAEIYGRGEPHFTPFPFGRKWASPNNPPYRSLLVRQNDN